MKLSNLLPLVGIATFAYILLNIDLMKTLKIISEVNTFYLILVVILTAFLTLIKIFKWKVLIKSYGIDFSMKNSISAWLVGFFIGMVTPAKLGDLTRSLYLKEKTSVGRSLTTVIIDRVIDVIILVVFAVVGVFWFISIYSGYDYLFTYFLGILIILAALLLIFLKKGVMKPILRPFFRRLVPDRYKERISFTFNEFYSGLGIMKGKKPLVLLSVIIGIAAWLLSFLQYYLLSLGLGLDITFTFILMIVPITILLDTLPISFSGVGTRDAALIFFLSFIAISSEFAVSLSLLVLFLGYVLVGFLGFIIWLKKPIKLDLPAS